jgi:hypothetical protein
MATSEPDTKPILARSEDHRGLLAMFEAVDSIVQFRSNLKIRNAWTWSCGEPYQIESMPKAYVVAATSAEYKTQAGCACAKSGKLDSIAS